MSSREQKNTQPDYEQKQRVLITKFIGFRAKMYAVSGEKRD